MEQVPDCPSGCEGGLHRRYVVAKNPGFTDLAVLTGQIEAGLERDS